MSEDTSSAPANVSSGDHIAGYRLEEQIGQGGMAVVYRAHDERLDRRVALKVLAPGLAADTAFRTRFIRESRAAAAVDHPNIIPVYDAGDAGGFLFISMRYVQGGDLRSLLDDGQPLPVARAWHIITQVASALDAAHEHGLVHRDVKPANMLLDATSRTGVPHFGSDDDQHDHVYLSDFGISKRTVSSNLTSTGQFVGTLDYIAPEQIEGQAIDGRTDQYSLACAAFELLSGVPPFRRSLGLALISAHLSEKPPSLVAKRPGLPASVDLVLAKAMAKPMAHRYATCGQFALDLGRALGLASGQLEAAPFQPAGPPAPAHPATALAGQIAAETTKPAPAVTGPGGQRGYQQAPPQGTYQPAQSPQGTYQPAQSPQGTYQPAQSPQGTYQPAQSPQGTYQPAQYPQGTFPQGTYPPAQYQQPPAPARRSRGLVIGAVLATVVVAAAVSVVAIKLAGSNGGQGHGSQSSPPQSSSPASSAPATAMAQAVAVSNLLSTSETTRGQLQPAVSAIQDQCSSLTSSQLATEVATIKTVAMQRRSEYARAQQLQTGLLRSGAELKTDLLAALQYSMKADGDYLQWAQQEQSGCFPATQSQAFNAAGNADVQAADAKTSFANLWNSIAPKYSQPTVQQQDI